MLHAVVFSSLTSLCTTSFLQPAQAAGEKWKSETIRDALLAAPPSVTDDAAIYGWTAEGDFTLALPTETDLQKDPEAVPERVS